MPAKSGTAETQKIASEMSPAAVETVASGIETVEVSIEVRGKSLSFECPGRAEDVPFDFFLKMEEEKPLSAFAVMLGDQGLAKMRRAGATQEDFNQFVTKWTEVTGLGNE